MVGNNNDMSMTAVTGNNNALYHISQCNPNNPQEPGQLSTYTSTQEVQNTASLLTQHQYMTQQRIISNITPETIKLKRQRMIYSSSQMLYLENVFAKSRYLDRTKRLYVAQQLNLTERQVKVWYQNKRMKEKRIQKKIGRSTSTRSATAVDAVAAQSRAAPPPSGHCYRQQQQQQQRQQQQQQQQQQDRDPELELEHARPTEHHLHPNPSVTVHHYPTWRADVPAGLFDACSAAAGPRRSQTCPSLHHRRQPRPFCATQRGAGPVPQRRAALPTYEEAIGAHERPTLPCPWDRHGEHRQHLHHQQHQRGQQRDRREHGAPCFTAVTAQQPQVQAGVTLASDPAAATRAVFGRGLAPELQVDCGTLIF